MNAVHPVVHVRVEEIGARQTSLQTLCGAAATSGDWVPSWAVKASESDLKEYNVCRACADEALRRAQGTAGRRATITPAQLNYLTRLVQTAVPQLFLTGLEIGRLGSLSKQEASLHIDRLKEAQDAGWPRDWRYSYGQRRWVKDVTDPEWKICK